MPEKLVIHTRRGREEYDIFTPEEAASMNTLPWREVEGTTLETGVYAVLDDGYACEVIEIKEFAHGFKGKKPGVVLPVGHYWRIYTNLRYETVRDMAWWKVPHGAYRLPLAVEANRKSTHNAVALWLFRAVHHMPFDDEMYRTIGIGRMPKPWAKAKVGPKGVLLTDDEAHIKKGKAITRSSAFLLNLKYRMDDIYKAEGIDAEWVLKQYLDTHQMAKDKQDIKGRLSALDRIADAIDFKGQSRQMLGQGDATPATGALGAYADYTVEDAPPMLAPVEGVPVEGVPVEGVPEGVPSEVEAGDVG